MLMITIRNDNDYQYHLMSQLLWVIIKMRFKNILVYIFTIKIEIVILFLYLQYELQKDRT